MPEQNHLGTKVTEVEKIVGIITLRLNRIESDIESEKETRTRVNSEVSMRFNDLDKRLLSVEKTIWKGVGAIMAFSTLIGVAMAIILKSIK